MLPSRLVRLLLGGCFVAAVQCTFADLSDVIPQFSDLDRWAVLALSQGNEFSNHSRVDGDIAIVGAGPSLFEDNTSINGNIYLGSGGFLARLDQSSITGAIFRRQDAMLNGQIAEAAAVSDYASSLAATDPNTSVRLRGSQTMTISGAPGATVVLSLRNFRLSGNATFTLEGTATTTFVINVRNRFSLSRYAHIELSGVSWADVLFNVTGGRNINLRGHSSFEGVLLATGREVDIRGHALVDGEVISRRLYMGRHGYILYPPVVSP